MTREEAVKAWHNKYDADPIGQVSDEALEASWLINQDYPLPDPTIPCKGRCEH